MKNKEEMINVYKENVDIKRLLKDENTISISKDRSDFISYPEFLKYFRDIKKITKHDVVIGINFTYGWMPTIFDFRSNDIDLVIDILNRAKQGKVPSENELEILKKCFNNSLVGTSKLLHFINPDIFAIWDSRVFRYLTNKEPHQNRIDDYKSYLDYLELCKFLTSNPEYNSIHNSIIKKVGYEMTKFRTVELIMYLKGGKNNSLLR
jgi:hypothetical protein